MKKFLAMLLAVIMLLGVVGCAKDNNGSAQATTAPVVTEQPKPAETEKPAQEATPVPAVTAAPEEKEDAADIINEYFAEIAANEYGYPNFIAETADGMDISVAYPIGFETLDSQLQSWAKSLIKDYSDKASLLPADSNGEKCSLTVDYYSYDYDHYVSVLELGDFYANQSGKTQYIAKGVIFDTDKQEVVSLKKLLSDAEYRNLYAKVLSDAAKEGKNLYSVSADELLANAVLWNNMIIVAYANKDVFFHVGEVYDKLPLITPTPTPAPTKAPTPAPTAKPATQKAYVNGNKVNIRAAASSSSKAIAQVPIAYEIQVVDSNSSNGWTRIWFNNGYAYIFTKYVTYKQPTPTVIATGYVNGKTVNVRSEPNTTSTKLGVVKYQTPVKIILREYVKGWDQILYNGKVAYISSKYVDEVKPTPTPTAVPKPKKIKPSWYSSRPAEFEDMGTIKTNNVPAYSKTNDKSDYYEKLEKGTVVFIVDKNVAKGWYTVWIETLEDSTKGYYAYVKSAYVNIAPFVGPVY